MMPAISLPTGSLEASNDGQNFELVDHQEAQTCHDGDFIVYQME